MHFPADACNVAPLLKTCRRKKTGTNEGNSKEAEEAKVNSHFSRQKYIHQGILGFCKSMLTLEHLCQKIKHLLTSHEKGS